MHPFFWGFWITLGFGTAAVIVTCCAGLLGGVLQFIGNYNRDANKRRNS